MTPHQHASPWAATRQWFAAWRLHRRWPIEGQLEHLRRHVQEDAQWLASDPIASALCQRYLDMLADDWFRRPTVRVSDLRERLGLDPHKKKPAPVTAQPTPETPCQ